MDCWLAASRPGANALCIIRRRTNLAIIKKTCIDIRERWANINNLHCSHKRMESWTRVGKVAFCRNTTIHFLNFEIYKRSLYHEGRALCKQVISHGSRTVFPYYIMIMANKEDASSYLSSSDVWQLCILSVVSCHQYL